MPSTATLAESNSAATTTATGTVTGDTSGGFVVVGVNFAGAQTGHVGTDFTGIFGTLTVNADGSYRYVLDNQDNDTNLLSNGEVAHDRFVVTYVRNGQTQTLALDFAINGTDEPGQVTRQLTDTLVYSSDVRLDSDSYIDTTAATAIRTDYSVTQGVIVDNYGAIYVHNSNFVFAYGPTLTGTPGFSNRPNGFNNYGRVTILAGPTNSDVGAAMGDVGVNNGVISASQTRTDVSVSWQARATAWSVIKGVNNGLVEAFSSHEAHGVAGARDFVNNGLIYVEGGESSDPRGITGITGGGVGSQITNHGTIYVASAAPGHATVGVSLSPNSTNPYAPLGIINTGTIVADQAIVAVGGYNAATNLDNSGHIEGSITVDSGVNLFVNRAGGVIIGSITGGGDADFLDNEGTITGTVMLGAGGDTFIAGGQGSVSGIVHGDGGDDVLFGGAAGDRLTGDAGNDWIAGGGGADSLTGGAGNDTFAYRAVADSTASTRDLISDFETGIDKIDLSALGASSFTLSSSGAQTVLSATTAQGTLSVVINGAVAAGDVVNIAMGSTLTGTALGDALVAGSGSTLLLGLGGNDALVGGAGNDTLDGGAGNDGMVGGAGNDTYYVDSGQDRVIEESDGGVDELRLTASYTLQAYVENAVLLGNEPIGVRGNALANLLVGNDAGNSIAGEGGNDTIIGGGGPDYILMVGGSATAVYRSLNDSWNSAPWETPAFDYIAGFDTGVDHIDLTALHPNYFIFKEYVLNGNRVDNPYFVYYGPQMDYPVIVNSWTEVTIGLPDGELHFRVSGHIDINDMIWNRAAGQIANIYGGDGNDSLAGTALADNINAYGGNDSIAAGAGDDLIQGGRGINHIAGGEGNDTLLLDSYVGGYRMASFGGKTIIFGNGTWDEISGIETLRIGGSDYTPASIGGRGTVLSYIASHGDLIRAFGLDTQAALAHYLAFGVAENRAITFDPAAYLAKYADLRAAYGNDLQAAEIHYISHGYAEGRQGNLEGDDYLTGTDGNDDINGGAGNDSIDAGAGVNHIYGGSGTDTLVLQGPSSAYVMAWVYGKVALFGNGAWDELDSIEQINVEGNTVSFDQFVRTHGSTLSYILSYADLIRTFGNGTEAAQNHYLTYGLAEGRRILFDPAAYLAKYADLRASFGDNVRLAESHYFAYGYVEGRSSNLDGNDTLTGTGGADTLNGGAGDDVINPGTGRNLVDGGTGYDTLRLTGNGAFRVFGVGDQTFVVGIDQFDTVSNIEAINIGGQVQAWSDFSAHVIDPLAYIAANPDLIRAFGTDYASAALHFVRYGIAEGRSVTFDAKAYLAKYADLRAAFDSNVEAAEIHFITHGFAEGRSTDLSGNDRLIGTDGADTLGGEAGADTLTGGLGADTFLFNTAPVSALFDTITDFVVGADKIAFDHTVFGALGGVGPLSAAAFWAAPGATTAHAESDRLIYDTSTGNLYWDPDGTGPQSAIQIAHLSGMPPALSVDDFVIM